jgi:hypothetical protein
MVWVGGGGTFVSDAIEINLIIDWIVYNLSIEEVWGVNGDKVNG